MRGNQKRERERDETREREKLKSNSERERERGKKSKRRQDPKSGDESSSVPTVRGSAQPFSMRVKERLRSSVCARLALPTNTIATHRMFLLSLSLSPYTIKYKHTYTKTQVKSSETGRSITRI